MLLDESISFLFTVKRLKLSTKCLKPKKSSPAMHTIGTVLAKTNTIDMMIKCCA